MNAHKPSAEIYISLQRRELFLIQEGPAGVQKHEDVVTGQVLRVDCGGVLGGVAGDVTRGGGPPLERLYACGYRLVPVAGCLAEYQHVKWGRERSHRGVLEFSDLDEK